MAKRWLFRLILNGHLHDARQARLEAAAALVLWLYLFFLILGMIAVGHAAVWSLFLHQFALQHLALVYTLVGLVVGAALYGISWLTCGLAYHRMALATIGVVSGGTAAFRLLLPAARAESKDLSYGLLYVFIESLGIITTIQFWTLCNRLFSPAQARRLYVFIATGGIVGSIAGGVVTRYSGLGARDLLWVIAGVGVPVAILIVLFQELAERIRAGGVKDPLLRPAGEEHAAGFAGRPRNLLRHPIWRRSGWPSLAAKLGLVTLLTVAATQFVQFYFQSFAADSHANLGGLTRFFGGFYLLVGCASLALQFLVTPLILRKLSVFGGLLLFPMLLGLGVLCNLVHPMLAGALLLKLIDSGMSHSVYRSCTELLYVPLPAELTGDFKWLSDGIAGRLGLVLAGLALFALHPLLGYGRGLLLAILVLLGLWMAALEILQGSYRRLLSRENPANDAAWMPEIRKSLLPLPDPAAGPCRNAG